MRELEIFRSSKMECSLYLGADRGQVAAGGFDSNHSLLVKGQPVTIELLKLGAVFSEWTLGGIVRAAAPEFFGPSIEENRCQTVQQKAILVLNEGATSERDHAILIESGDHVLESGSFGSAEVRFTMIAKDGGYRFAFAGFDESVQVEEFPAETASQFLSDARFAGGHESD